MTAFSSDYLIDQIYEAALVPDVWPAALQGVADNAGALGASLFTSDARQMFRWTSSDSIRALMQLWNEQNWQPRSQRPARMLKANRQGFVRDIDVYSMEELQADESWRGFHLPHGIGWAAGTFVKIPTGDVAIFSIEREYVNGPMTVEDVERLDALRPHLARAALLAVRLDFERSRTAVRVLEALGLPAAALSRNGRVIAANDKMIASKAAVKIYANDVLRFDHPGPQNRFTNALSRLSQEGFGGASFAVPAADRSAVIAHVVPIRRSGHDIIGSSDAVLVVTPVEVGQGGDVRLIEGLFDLSASEAKVASQIAQGLTIEEIADRNVRSRETIRSHLKRVYEKTGVNRQAELASLLSGVRGIN
jgi:DNA-binding CsgD family transcriptional regulator